MQDLFTTSTPLGAGGVVASGWLDFTAGAGDIPYIVVRSLADQAGSLAVIESETASSTEYGPVISPVTLANVPHFYAFTQSRKYLKITYTNGSVAQTSFSLTISGSVEPNLLTETIRRARIDELILRELRIQSLLLLQLKEPTGTSAPNVPFGPNQMGT